MGEINGALRRNWTLLVRVLDGAYRKQVRRAELEALGFRWNYMTELFVGEGGRTFHLVYDCAWAELPDGDVLILRKGWREQEHKYEATSPSGGVVSGPIVEVPQRLPEAAAVFLSAFGVCSG